MRIHVQNNSVTGSGSFRALLCSVKASRFRADRGRSLEASAETMDSELLGNVDRTVHYRLSNREVVSWSSQMGYD